MVGATLPFLDVCVILRMEVREKGNVTPSVRRNPSYNERAWVSSKSPHRAPTRKPFPKLRKSYCHVTLTGRSSDLQLVAGAPVEVHWAELQSTDRGDGFRVAE